MPSLAEFVAVLEDWYPPATAMDWDAVGLVTGDPEDEVRRVLLAVDPVAEVVAEAADVDLLVVHHPLLLRGVHSVATSTPKGRVIHDLIRHGTALYAAHTNADTPAGGVSDAIAQALGLRQVRPLDADGSQPLHKITVFAPVTEADRIRAAMTHAGAGALGDYDHCTWQTTGEGRFRPLAGASPAIGTAGGDIEVVQEVRIEAVADPSRTVAVRDAILAAHPYETPAFDIVSGVALPDPDRGLGRVGEIEPTTLAGFAEQVAAVLPATAHGIRVAGDPDRPVRRIALLGGAGDSHLAAARASGADVYLTSDLRHHPASEFLESGGPALIDVAHWAAEWMWLPVLQERLRAHWGDTVETVVSTLNTDPWTFRLDGSPARTGEPR